MSDIRVLIADNVHPGCDEILVARGIDVVRLVGADRTELVSSLPEFHGLIVRSAVTVDRELIEGMERMQAIGRAGAGVDNIDIPAATERGILVMNTPGGNTVSAAEHTLALLFSLLRKIPAANSRLREGMWERKAFTGTEVQGKAVGIIGLGRIGREVAHRLGGFGVTLLGFDPVLSPEAVDELQIRPVSFEEILELSDIITVHVPLLPETRGLVGPAQLSAMKPGVFLVNCARGGIVDEAALFEALESGQVAGAAVDVFEDEPPVFPNKLVDHPRVIATPHIAASTAEAQKRVALAIAEQMADFFEGKGVAGVVNATGLEDSLKGEMFPYMRAASRLGEVLGQLAGAGNMECRLTVYGPSVNPIVRGLGASFLAGIVGREHHATVNAINAGMLAQELGITLVTSGEKVHPGYHVLLSAMISGSSGERRAAVTVFGKHETRLVMLDDVWFDISPSGPMVLLENRDRPGVLAAIGSVLASHAINIADLSLGRQKGRGNALTLVRLDEEVTDAARMELLALDGVDRVDVLRFHDNVDYSMSEE